MPASPFRTGRLIRSGEMCIRDSYSMEFDSYGECPKTVAEEIIAKGRGGA